MRRILSLVLAILLISSYVCSGAFGEMMSSVVGVGAGDVFRYSYICYFNSSDPHAVLPAALISINQTNYFMINVTGVSGSAINFNTMLLSLNGSSYLGVCSMNVGSGSPLVSGYGGPSSFYFMARNVGMMGKMFPSIALSPTVNDTLMMSYAGASRLTNHFVTTDENNLINVLNSEDMYFDHATGMLVQWRHEVIQTSGSIQTNTTQIMKMTSSSVWDIPEFPTSIIVVSFIIVASVSTLAILKSANSKRTIPRINL